MRELPFSQVKSAKLKGSGFSLAVRCRCAERRFHRGTSVRLGVCHRVVRRRRSVRRRTRWGALLQFFFQLRNPLLHRVQFFGNGGRDRLVGRIPLRRCRRLLG